MSSAREPGTAAGPRAVAAWPRHPELAGRVAVVTGGSRGIGAATCRALAANRVRVAVVARGLGEAQALASELRRQGAQAIGVSADATRRDEVLEVRRRVEAELGPPDIVLPFAGGFRSRSPVQEIGEEEWRWTLDACLTSTFLTCGAFLPGMLARRRGVIVTMSSSVGRLVDEPVTAPYAAARAAVAAYTRHLALELGPHGVRANCVAPATTLSERVEAALSEPARRRLSELSPLGRLGSPEDVAGAVLFLVSDSAAWLTGLTVDVAGGRVML